MVCMVLGLGHILTRMLARRREPDERINKERQCPQPYRYKHVERGKETIIYGCALIVNT